MTQEEKQLLIKDLCSRLPYGVKVNHIIYNWEGTAINFNRKLEYFAMEKDNGLCYDVPIEEVLPYLRPMSSMTEEEKKQYRKTQDKIPIQWDNCGESTGYTYVNTIKTYDWLNANHFNYRLPPHLFIEAKEGIYKQ